MNSTSASTVVLLDFTTPLFPLRSMTPEQNLQRSARHVRAACCDTGPAHHLGSVSRRAVLVINRHDNSRGCLWYRMSARHMPASSRQLPALTDYVRAARYAAPRHPQEPLPFDLLNAENVSSTSRE